MRGIRPPAGAVENMRRLGLIRPRDLLPSPSLGGPPAAGRQRVFVGKSSLCRRMFSGLSVVACRCGGTGDLGLFAPQSSCPRFSLGAGVTPAVHSEGPAPLAMPRRYPYVPSWHVSVVPGATEVAVRAGLDCSASLGAAVQRRPRKYSEVTGASVAGRAVT